MSDSDLKNHNDSNSLSTWWFVFALCLIALIMIGVYFVNFNYQILKAGNWSGILNNLSEDNGKWGTFGDYVRGILNPIVAAFAFYLIAKSYELQKRELEATRGLLKVSTEAQNMQITLAALTSLLNSVLMRIDNLNSEKFSLLQGAPVELKKPDGTSALPSTTMRNPEVSSLYETAKKYKKLYNEQLSSVWFEENPGTLEGKRFIEIEREVTRLTRKLTELENKIESYL